MKMKLFGGSMSLVFLLASLAFGASRGMISGSVKAPGGAPFPGAFVRARNVNTKITVSVLSNKQGQYRIQDLPPGEYELRVNAIGYRSEPQAGVKVAVGQALSFDLSLQEGIVRWSDLSIFQGKMLFPEGEGKKELVTGCFACHGFQSRMATTRRDEAGWQRAVDFMRTDFVYFLGEGEQARVTDTMAHKIVSYLTTLFGVDSELPRTPAQLSEYEKVKRDGLSDEASKIVYVEYELPAPNRFPWSGYPDKEGNIWIPYYGRANHIAKLNPETGEVQEFRVPNPSPAAIHSAVAALDGTVWIAEQGPNKIAKFDPRTQEFTEYPGTKTKVDVSGGSKSTVRVDPQGYVWSSGTPLSRLDPKTGKFTEFWEDVPSCYSIEIDKEGNVWFTDNARNKLGKYEAKTGKFKMWDAPTPKSFPRRIVSDAEGIIWFAEYNVGKIARFDPKTETFKEYQLPGVSPTPYALALDRGGRIWYSSYETDIYGRLDPKTGKVIEYPIPFSENGSREFFMDSEGRMWFGAPPNNRVGYFVPPQDAETTLAESKVSK